MQLPVYEGPSQQHQPQAPVTPRTTAGGGALPPPSPKDVESELLRTHMQVLSTYVDRCAPPLPCTLASPRTHASLPGHPNLAHTYETRPRTPLAGMQHTAEPTHDMHLAPHRRPDKLHDLKGSCECL